MMAIDFGAIRADYPLASIVERTVPLRRSGANKVGCCPFHPDRSPSFVVYQDETYHCFGCSAHGDVIDFVGAIEHLSTAEAIRFLTGDNTPSWSEEDRARRAAERSQQEAEQKRRQARAIQEAGDRWTRALPINGTGSGYLDRKRIAPYGCRREGENLLVPIVDADGAILSVQSIPPEPGGRKLFHAGAPVAGGRMLLGDRDDGPIITCEGFATGATIQAATGYLVAVAFSKGNLAAVAAAMARAHPGREIVIAADTNGVDAANAAAAPIKARVVVPDMQGAEGTDFNDQAFHYGEADVAATFEAALAVAPEPPNPGPIVATPFVWRAERDIPRREWIYGKHLLRRYVSVDVAAGGIGKSSLKIGEALAMASGRDIYGQGIHGGPHVVWLYNLEDPAEETERRLHAAAKRFEIPPAALEGMLYVDTGREQACVIAEDTGNGVKIVRPVVESIIHQIKLRNISVLVIDPFISSHAVSENDNMAIDIVVKQWASIAHECNCSINLVHHVRKQNGTEASADSARGASSLVGAARSVMVFNRMSEDDAAKVGVPEDEARFYFRVDNDKANLAPPTSTTWYRMNNTDLDNGDEVGVACPWQMPDIFAGVTSDHLRRLQAILSSGEYRESPQAAQWAGLPVAALLALDADDKKVRKRIAALLKKWLAEGVLEIVEQEDSKRMKRKFIVPGRPVL